MLIEMFLGLTLMFGPGAEWGDPFWGPSPGPPRPEIVFRAGFETGDLSQWSEVSVSDEEG